MKMINAINARNLFMDNLRKETLKMLIQNAATPFKMGIDISDFDSLTTDNAKKWLNSIDNLLFTLQVGTSLYNGNNYYMQTPKSDLVVVIPREYYMNVIRKAFPDTYNPESFQNILPDNLILIDTLGSADVAKSSASTTPLVPTWDSVGMNLLNYDKDTDVTVPFKCDPTISDSWYADEYANILSEIVAKFESDGMSHEDALNSVLSDHEELTYNQLVTMLEKYS